MAEVLQKLSVKRFSATSCDRLRTPGEGIRFCEAVGLQPADFDFDAGTLEVTRSVVKASCQHHPQGKTFLVRDYTKNGQTRRLKARRRRIDDLLGR